jgi:hypothetical protein
VTEAAEAKCRRPWLARGADRPANHDHQRVIIIVDKVLVQSPAHVAGVEEGDLIVGIQDKPVKGIFASAPLAGKEEQEHAELELTQLAQTCVALDLAIQKRGSLKTRKVVVHSRAVPEVALQMFAVLAHLAERVCSTDEAARQSLQAAFSLLNKNLQDQDLQDTYVRNRLLTGQRECLSALNDLTLLLKTAQDRSQQAHALALRTESDFMYDSCAPGPDLMGILLAASKVGLDGDDDDLGNPPGEGSGGLIDTLDDDEAKVQLFEGLLANASLLD